MNTTGQGGDLVDVFDLPNEGTKPIDGLACELRDLRERWNNRLVLERCSLAELYIDGRLEIVIHGNWNCELEQSEWACRIKTRCAVLDNQATHFGVDGGDLHYRNDGDKVIVLPVFVQGVKVPKTLVRSVCRTYIFKEQVSKTGESLLYRREAGMGYKVFPWRKWEVERPLRSLTPGVNDCNRREVECLSDIVKCIPDDSGEDQGNTAWVERKRDIRIEIEVNDIFAHFLPRISEVVKFPIQRRTSGYEFINVAVGPLIFSLALAKIELVSVMADSLKATKDLMGALMRMKPKPHEEMKLGKPRGKKAKNPARRRASAKPKTA